MTFDEAMSAAVDGERVRAVDMQAGSYVDYHFNGWRRNFAGGASSGFNPTPHDRETEWEVYAPEPQRDSWGRFPIPNSVVETHKTVELSWDEVFADKQRTEGGAWRTIERDKWGRLL